MRPILRKIVNQAPLDDKEYERLLQYIEELRELSDSSYQVFYREYGSALARGYGLYLSRYSAGRAQLVQYLAANPRVVEALCRGPVLVKEFPLRLRNYLYTEYGEHLEAGQVEYILDWLARETVTKDGLPGERQGEAVLLYEAGNPRKEWGLKYHFERIARYPFVTRVQSVRYLSGKKARVDRLQVRGAERLAGIFTNREKSIYYLVYLSEAVPHKTENACKLLNLVFYG